MLSPITGVWERHENFRNGPRNRPEKTAPRRRPRFGRPTPHLAAIAEMKKHHVAYIRTISLDDSFPYGDSPKWVGDPFFSAALDPGVLEMITSPEYLPNIWTWR